MKYLYTISNAKLNDNVMDFRLMNKKYATNFDELNFQRFTEFVRINADGLEKEYDSWNNYYTVNTSIRLKGLDPRIMLWSFDKLIEDKELTEKFIKGESFGYNYGHRLNPEKYPYYTLSDGYIPVDRVEEFKDFKKKQFEEHKEVIKSIANESKDYLKGLLKNGKISNHTFEDMAEEICLSEQTYGIISTLWKYKECNEDAEKQVMDKLEIYFIRAELNYPKSDRKPDYLK